MVQNEFRNCMGYSATKQPSSQGVLHVGFLVCLVKCTNFVTFQLPFDTLQQYHRPEFKTLWWLQDIPCWNSLAFTTVMRLLIRPYFCWANTAAAYSSRSGEFSHPFWWYFSVRDTLPTAPLSLINLVIFKQASSAHMTIHQAMAVCPTASSGPFSTNATLRTVIWMPY